MWGLFGSFIKRPPLARRLLTGQAIPTLVGTFCLPVWPNTPGHYTTSLPLCHLGPEPHRSVSGIRCILRENLTIGNSPGIVKGVNDDRARPLGEWLQNRREELQIDLEQAEEATRIRAKYLQALEAEDFDSLPDPIVGRGFLRNYAVYLELDPQKASDLFTQLVAPPQPEPQINEETSPFAEPFRPVPLHKIPGQRRQTLWIVVLAFVVVAALAVLVWQFYPRISDWMALRASEPEPTATARATNTTTTLATATQTPTQVAVDTVTPTTVDSVEETPTLELTITPTLLPSPSPTPSPPVYTGIFLEMVLTDTSWVQITVDGVRQFQGELEAETYRSWYGDERIELRLGNAGGVLVTINGQLLGTLGELGEVLDRVFEKVGDQVNEVTPTPSPDITGTVTAAVPTVAPTATIIPTPTLTSTQAITVTATP